MSEEFVKQMRDEATALEKITHIPFFRQVGRFMGLRQESLALQRKQGYAEIYDTWLKLQRSLDLTGDGLNVGNRPIWKLYEFWCFLVIRDFLQAKYKDFDGGLGDVADAGIGEAVRKMTSLPASVFRIPERGLIRPGYFADLVVFDPAELDSPADFRGCNAPPAGIDRVLVAGETAWCAAAPEKIGRFGRPIPID